jgi:hypothetical protein
LASPIAGPRSKKGVPMNFAEVEHRLCHDILEQTEDPMAIEAAVARLLESLDRESLFAVWEVAKNFAEAKEFADRDGDLDVVRSLGAALQPMISWLEGNGIEGGSFTDRAGIIWEEAELGIG